MSYKLTLSIGFVVMSFLLAGNLAVANTPPAGCKNPVNTCLIPGGTKYFDGVPVYEKCWKYSVAYTCPDWSTYTNSCADITDCTATGQPVIVNPWEKQLPMSCSSSTETYTCSQYQNKQICGKAFTYAQGYNTFTPVPTKNFSQAMGAMGVLDALQKQVSGNPIEVFAGQGIQCHQPINLGPFTTDCCNEQLHTHGSNWSLNQCSLDEIKLASARRAERTVYLGSWCSHYLTWLHAICTVHKQGYCAFNSMLGRIVQQQGREQIDALAAGGGGGTSQAFSWPYTAATGQWNQTTVNGVSVAAYSYQALAADDIPIYLASTDPLDVDSGSSNSVAGVNITMNCSSGVCTGNLQQGGNTPVPYSMNPTCSTPAAWGLTTAGVKQGVCLSEGQQPTGWPHITWNGTTPNLWQFQVLSSQQSSISNGQLNTVLPDGKTVSANGSCSGNNCQYNIAVANGANKQTGTLAFPLNCTSSSKYTATIDGVSLAPVCVPQNEIFAVCTQGSSCGTLPTNPLNDVNQTINGWSIVQTDLSVPSYQFLSQSIAVKGACADNSCNWSVMSIGQGGYPTTLTSAVTWNMYSAPVSNAGSPQPGYMQIGLDTPMNVVLKPYLYANKANAANGFKLQYQLAGQAWQQYPNVVPLTVPSSSPITLSSDPTTQMYGSCDTTTGICKFTLTSQVQVQAMPWGSAQNPQCEGFTPEELMLINFSKINLSQYISTISSNFSQNEQNQLSKYAKNSLNNFENNFNNGDSQNSPSPNNSNNVVLKAEPSEGQGPFTTTLYATAYWPKYIPFGQCGYPVTGTQNPEISSVAVNWGDGNTQTLTSGDIQTVQVTGKAEGGVQTCTYSVPVFVATHQYGQPDGQNAMETITGTFDMPQGYQTSTFNVENYWNTPGTISGQGGGASNPTNNPVQPNQAPGGTTFNPGQVPGTPTESQ